MLVRKSSDHMLGGTRSEVRSNQAIPGNHNSKFAKELGHVRAVPDANRATGGVHYAVITLAARESGTLGHCLEQTVPVRRDDQWKVRVETFSVSRQPTMENCSGDAAHLFLENVLQRVLHGRPTMPTLSRHNVRELQYIGDVRHPFRRLDGTLCPVQHLVKSLAALQYPLPDGLYRGNPPGQRVHRDAGADPRDHGPRPDEVVKQRARVRGVLRE